MRLASIAERILLTLWVGGLWAIGYLAVPVLFNSLNDRRLAGEVAGQMFGVLSLVGLVCGALLLARAIYVAGKTWHTAWRVWSLVAMLVLVATSAFVLQPMMQELKAAGLLEGSTAAKHFGQLHGAASIMYLITSLLGLALVVAGPGKERSADFF